jgi:adenine-specific DNA-methyltransferase
MDKARVFNTVYVTRYMGAKYKLLDLIVPLIEELLPPDGTLLDVMAGTHAVGYSLKTRNQVIANDIQHYSSIFGEAILANNSVSTLRDRYLKEFNNLEPSKYKDSWLVKTYGDTYFSKRQCAEIAAIRDRINGIKDKHAKNLYLTVLANAMSLCQSSSGHFAQYFPKDHPRLKTLRAMSVVKEFEKKCKEIELVKSNFDNRVFKMEAIEFLNSDQIIDLAPSGSLVYFDPPYSSAQYSRYYHLLETVFLDDSPEVNFKGLYRGDRHQSDFCSQVRVKPAFERVIQSTSTNRWNLVISYSDTGLLHLKELVKLCKTYYKHVEVIQQEYGHSTQGRGNVSKVQELVISCHSVI